MRAAVLVFPGSNCDHDALDAAYRLTGTPPREIWHRWSDLGGVAVVILPGGFSYGDYLRSGAIARFSPVMDAVALHANSGGFVLGICNGFQVLTEAALLPGVLIRNANLRFVCREVCLRVERNDTAFTHRYRRGQVIRLPIAHNEGNFYLPEPELDELEARGQVVFRYCDEHGNVTRAANPNGSARNIAGIISRDGNVLGMMPHPERRTEALLGGEDGTGIFLSLDDHTRGR